MSSLQPVVVPQVNPNDPSAVLVRWHIETGAVVGEGQLMATLETTKAAFDVVAPGAGYAFFDLDAGSVVEVGSAIAWLSPEPVRPDTLPALRDAASAGAAQAAGPRFSRKALRRMRELGLTEADFPGDGRIEVADVDGVAREGARTGRSNAPPASVPVEDTVRLEQSAAKLIEVRLLRGVYRQVVPSTVCIAVSSGRIAARLRSAASVAGPVSLLEVVLHEVARLLPEFPPLNGFFADGAAWSYGSVSVGFAMNAGRGLRVPVVRNASQLTQQAVAVAMRDLSLKYLRDELRIEDLTGGTFTITDLSTKGVVHFLPVINQGQSAILGLCAERPGTGHQDMVLCFDHRMTDGMQAAEFLCALRERLENELPG
jgi:2-oxoglutarate dehydrogenase E2 component (dihydrolipoamide succinyltransferase)